MTYTLHIGDKSYSSWSLRGWLLLRAFDIPFEERFAKMKTPDFEAMVDGPMAPARLVPALQTPHGVVWDSLAIAETLHEAHPEAGIWPADPAARAAARSLAAEMHSGFMALRREASMNLRRRYPDHPLSDDAKADVARLERIWAWALDRFGGPWLGGAAFSAADAFYAPTASRLHTYGVAGGPVAQGYVDRIMAHPAMTEWIKAGMNEPWIAARYELVAIDDDTPNPTGPAAAYDGAVSACVNVACPVSGKPVRADSLASLGGAVIGFCNPGCRDSFVANPAAHPAALRLLAGRATA